MSDWDESCDTADNAPLASLPTYNSTENQSYNTHYDNFQTRDRYRGNMRGNRGFNTGRFQRNNFNDRYQQNGRNDRCSEKNYNDNKRGFQDQSERSKPNFYESKYQTNDASSLKTSNNDVTDDPPFIDWEGLCKAREEEEERILSHLPTVKKNTYVENPAVKNLSKQQVEIIRDNLNKISVSQLTEEKKLDIPNPVTTFEQALAPYPKLLEKIAAQKFLSPSPIQCQFWPILMQGYDAVGVAQTGTGKTLAYLLPAILHIEAQPYFKDPDRKGPLVLVMAPTRELAQQIHNEVLKFNYHGIKSVCVYGQGSYSEQSRALRSGVEVVVATPGRLNDFVNKGIVDLTGVSYLVLDEADRMLDMGFQPDILKVNAEIRKDRQAVLTSATWPHDVEYIAKRLMKDAIKVVVGQLDLAAAATVTQTVIVCEDEDKEAMLTNILRDLRPEDKVIVFSNKKAVVDQLSVMMCESDINVRVMHGGVEQCDRESALADLKDGSCRILLATDVASRGLDVIDLTLVINLDLPKNLEEYVHRSGRTGRAGRTGEVVSFFTWANRNQAAELIDILNRSDQEVPPELSRMAERAARYQENNRGRGGFRGGGRGGGSRGGGGRGGRRGGRDRNDFVSQYN